MMMGFLCIQAPGCGDDEVLSWQCWAEDTFSSDPVDAEGSLCSETEALSVEESHRVRPELVLPRSDTKSCTCKGVGADGLTKEERRSLRMPQRSSLRSSCASPGSDALSSEALSRSCSMTSESSVTVRHPSCHACPHDVSPVLLGGSRCP